MLDPIVNLIIGLVVSLIFGNAQPVTTPTVAEFEMQTGIAATDNMNTFGRK